MRRFALLLLALTFALPATAAQLYRWTDAQGGVHYSDQPPPPNIKKMEQIQTPDEDQGPAAGQSGAPVVLFSGNCGPTCDQAAAFLRQHDIPFALKNADQDPAVAKELKQRTGSMGVPVLFVGESMQRGYSPTIWEKMLEVAGYSFAAKPQNGGQQGGSSPAPASPDADSTP